MKKIITVLLLLVVVSFIFIYILIPQNLNEQSNVSIKTNLSTFQRLLSQKEKRMQWLPKETKPISENIYALNDIKFRFYIDNSFTNNITIENSMPFKNILTGNETKTGTTLNWLIECKNNYNPITRIENYLKIKKIKKCTKLILSNIDSYATESKNIYGLNIEKNILVDSTLISIKTIIKNYPKVEDIYSSISKLEKYAQLNNALATNSPMLNIEKIENNLWAYMVALPINKGLENNNEIIAKRMFAGGKILITENIIGGFYTVDSCIKKLEYFKSDNNFLSPAISYQSLITDRRVEKDSAKWETKLYYPIY